MSRELQLATKLLQWAIRSSRGKGSWKLVVALAVGALLYSFVLQPVAQSSFGIALPSILAESSSSTSTGIPPRSTGERSESTKDFDPADLSDVLEEIGRGAYRSEAGLRYTRGSQHGHRLAHLMSHAQDAPNRPGQHGVYDDEDPATVVRLVDEAYAQALYGKRTRTRREEERTIYTIDLGRRIGYIGGESGGRRGHPSATHLRLVVEGDRLITAFPVRP